MSCHFCGLPMIAAGVRPTPNLRVCICDAQPNPDVYAAHRLSERSGEPVESILRWIKRPKEGG